MMRNLTEPATMVILEYEEHGDKRVLNNTLLRTKCTFVGSGTEYHINIKDSNQVKGTHQIFQV
eukprot:2285742-Ditylum_brightwellii.AAC.2